jgi:dTMP kinase
MKHRGRLITFEGNEGCGKSTQIGLLYQALKKAKKKVFLTREPGGTKVSDAIRSILLEPKYGSLSPATETLLYMASRAELVRQVIAPKLKKGVIVLCDRWLDATVAYQGYAGGVDVNWIQELGDKVTGGIRPDLSIFLDLPLMTGLERAKKRKTFDRIERKAIHFHRNVRRGYDAIAAAEPKRFRRLPIKPDDPISTVHRHVMEMVKNVV